MKQISFHLEFLRSVGSHNTQSRLVLDFVAVDRSFYAKINLRN